MTNHENFMQQALEEAGQIFSEWRVSCGVRPWYMKVKLLTEAEELIPGSRMKTNLIMLK